MIALALVAGIVLALPYLSYVRRSEERMPGLLGLGLVVAALIYVALALVGGGGSVAVLVELTGVAMFGFLAWSGANRHLGYVAAGWMLHVLWDFALHVGDTTGASYTPGWYPWVCVGFDVAVAVVAARMAGLLPTAERP